MRGLISIFIFLTAFSLYGQTDSIEVSLFYKKALSKEISGEEFSTTIKKWNQTIKKNNIYPKLPLNTEGKIQYSFVIDFPDLSKKMLFNRILEWLSISYGIIPAYLYSNLDDGRIICSNGLKVSDNISSSYTYVISIKDNKVLIDYLNLGYQENLSGYYSGDTWIAERSIFKNIDQIFPIIFKESSKWRYYINILTTINKQLDDDVESLNQYLIKYDSRYSF